jgi:hypothetical protein
VFYRKHALEKECAWGHNDLRAFFPSAAHDDMADMMSQAAAWLLQTSVPTLTISNAFTGAIIAQY